MPVEPSGTPVTRADLQRGGRDSAAPEGNALLLFALGPKRLALPAETVVEVAQVVEIAAVPSGPPILEGAIDYRGRVVPVLDARRRFGVPPAPLDLDQHLIVARAGVRTVALRVDRALDLRRVEATDLVAAHAAVPEALLTAGVARLADGVVVIHDLEAFLSADEGAAVDAALEALSSGADLAAPTEPAGEHPNDSPSGA